MRRREEAVDRRGAAAGAVSDPLIQDVDLLFARLYLLFARAQFGFSDRDVVLRPFERLFFECYSRGVQGEQPFARMLPGAVEDWLVDDGTTARTIDPALTRLGLAVARGLLLDLVATQDDDGVDAAAKAFIELIRQAGVVR